MSLLEENDTPLTREDAVNQVIASIAYEELALGLLLTAEGEKLQYILGTLSGSTGSSATIEEVLEANRSVREVLDGVLEDQTLLRNKLKDVLDSAVLTGPTGPTGSAQFFGIQAKLLGKEGAGIGNNETIVFDNVSTRIGSAITYNGINGEFTISQSGYYRVDWWATIDGANATTGIVFALIVDGRTHSRAVAPPVTSQVSGSALVVIDATPAILSIRNISGNLITFEAGIDLQANIVIMSIPV